jgi:regulator of cell morphogenesis and NO signaling
MAHDCGCHHGSLGEVGKILGRIEPEQTVEEVAHRHPGALEIMKQMGINHCCGAHLTLTEAAASAGVTLDALLAALNEPRQIPA